MITKIFKHKVLVFGSIIVIVVAIVSIFVYQKLNSSVSVSLSSRSTNNSNYYSINLSPKQVSDKYVSFDYPKGLKLKSTTLAGHNSVDTYTFSAKDVYSWALDVDVATAPEGGITNLSSYKYRQDNPSQYSPSSVVINSRPVAIMTDDTFSGFSKVAYLSNGGLIATISLTGEDNNGNAPLNTSFNMVLNSWQWH